MKTPDHARRDADSVREMFARVAPRYDRINRAMCFGLDSLWRRRAARAAVEGCAGGLPVLDLACGSGDIALELLKAGPSGGVCACDLCAEMLAVAASKIGAAGFSAETVRADAENLPFADASFGACTIGFGFRNFADRPKCLREIARVLAPGGGLFILEVARARPLFEPVQNFFMGCVVPSIAAALGGDRGDYRYLARTTRDFPRRAELEAMLGECGFARVSTEPYAFGFVALTKAFKK